MMDCDAQGSSKKPVLRHTGSTKSGGKKPTRSKRAAIQAAYRRRDLAGCACYMLDDLPTVDLEEMLRAAAKLHAIEPTHEHVRVALRGLVVDLITDHLGRDR
jgi:hypothetical protein